MERKKYNYDESIYMEGFKDGQRSMAIMVATRLLAIKDDDEISEITNLPKEDITSLRASIDEGQNKEVVDAAHEVREESESKLTYLRDTPSHGTALVEPSFVRIVRQKANLTQASLAKQIHVHENTVTNWETSSGPIRMKEENYRLLLSVLANTVEE